MPRILEKEVMDSQESVDAYTAATLNGGMASNFIDSLDGSDSELFIADLGCGPCGYYNHIFLKYPNSKITGYEASELMIQKARIATQGKNVKFENIHLPDGTLQESYDVILSSLLLHQLPEANVLWETIKQIGKDGSKFFVFDVLRVEDSNDCWEVVDGIVPDGVNVFKQDFYNTLRAGFTVPEIEQQLLDAGITATIETKEVYPNLVIVYITGTL